MKLPIYLDYSATTPVDPRVAQKMSECLLADGNFGNPASRSHVFGWKAEETVENARRQVAELVNADPREIVWTSGATESNNLAIKGVAHFYSTKGKHIITSKIEHKAVLDTCGGLGYFAACCLDAGVARIQSFEKNEDVLWLRTLNPWSPDPEAPQSGGRLHLAHADVSQAITNLHDGSFDCVLHDPPRFGIAGELYSQAFYDQLARVIKRGGRLFHYTGTPNRLTSGRDLPREVARRLEKSGFRAGPALDGVLATRR